MRKRTSIHLNLSLAILIGLFLNCQASSAVQYTVTDLGALGGIRSYGFGINDKGQIVGRVDTADGHQRAFLYSYGVMTDLGTLGGNSAEAGGINESGQITGNSYTGTAQHAFLYSNGVMTDLGALGGHNSYGHGINNSGQVTGQVKGHSFLYSNGVMTDLGVLGGHESSGYSINSSGQVTGYSHSNAPAYNQHAFLFSNGIMTDLGTLGGKRSFGRGINDNGQVTGFSHTAANYFHAFLYDNGTMTDLGTLGGNVSAGYGINNHSQITGSANTAAGDEHAFLYSNGIMTDLNTLIAPTSGWVLVKGYGINNLGQITGWGTNPQGDSHAFLLMPVSEPATLLLRGLGAVMLRGQIMKWGLLVMTLFFFLIVLPTILCKFICTRGKNISIWWCTLTVLICFAILYVTDEISKVLLPLLGISVVIDRHTLFNLLVVIPFYIVLSVLVMKKIFVIGIVRGIIMSIIFIACALVGWGIVTSIMLSDIKKTPAFKAYSEQKVVASGLVDTNNAQSFYGKQLQQKSGPSVLIKGILYSDRPSVLIGKEILHEGDTTQGVKVVKINHDTVEFEKNGKRWTQKVGETLSSYGAEPNQQQ